MDIVIALDDSNLTAIGEYLASSQPHGELLYGIGQSTEAIYYLDKGIAECVVVPDEFNVGYQSPVSYTHLDVYKRQYLHSTYIFSYNPWY